MKKPWLYYNISSLNTIRRHSSRIQLPLIMHFIKTLSIAILPVVSANADPGHDMT